MTLLDDVHDAYQQAGLRVTVLDNGSLEIDCPECGEATTVDDIGGGELIGIHCAGGCEPYAASREHITSGGRLPDISAHIKPGEPPPAGTRPRLRTLDTRRLITTPPPPIEWLADGIFAKGKFTLLGGREKGGKSLIQLALAFQMASGGGTVAGIDVNAGRVLIDDGENGEEELHRRIHGLGLPLKHADQLVLAEARCFNLSEHLDDIVDQVNYYKPDLVVLDSFRSLWSGSERDEGEIASALYPLAELAHSRGVAVSLTHHATKGDAGDYRGSTAIGAVPDWVCVLSRNRDDNDQMRRRLTTPYARFAPPREDRWLRICSDSDDGPVRLEACDAFVPERDAPARDEAEEAIKAFVRTSPLLHPPIDGGEVEKTGWTRSELLRGAGLDPKGGTADRAFKAVADAGLIYRNGDGKHWYRADALFDDEGA